MLSFMTSLILRLTAMACRQTGIDVFTRRYYNDFIIENLAWCQQNANLNIYASVIMTNHIHMVANVTDGSLGDVLGRFKSYASKELYKMIANNMQESRLDWMLKAFDRAGKFNPLNEKHQLWQNGNYPIVLYTPAVIEQKIDYTPVCRQAGMKTR